MRFLFVMDPAQTMLPDKDTSFAFMRAAIARGHECWHALPHEVSNQGQRVSVKARTISVANELPHVTLGLPTQVKASDLDAIFIRKDPPFDSDYLHLTQQLDLVKQSTLVLNDPAALRDANEKLFAFHFSTFMPESLVTSDRDAIFEFVKSVGGKAVIKPLDGAGGSGVLALSSSDKNARAIVDMHTHEGKKLALVQAFLPGIAEGDKRVLLLDGKVLGAILRVPRADDIRANIHVGGSVFPTTLTSEEALLASAVGAELSRRGLWFVGLDLIGGKLIEVNVTSPTGIQELSRFLKRPVEDDVIAWVETKSREIRAR